MPYFVLAQNTTRPPDHRLELHLADSMRLIGLLLRIGQSGPARQMARQLLASFPQALPLHLAIGRAALLDRAAGKTGISPAAAGHLQRVLDVDPENWRVWLELALFHLLEKPARPDLARRELWAMVQTAPDQLWVRQVLERLTEWPELAEVVRGYAQMHQVEENPTQLSAHFGSFVDRQAGLARLYLGRQMPWMAGPVFEKALRANEGGNRADLKTGLLAALWLNGESAKASSLASDLLLEQPRLLLPRLVLASQLSSGILQFKPDSLEKMLKAVWQLDPFLERASELLKTARLSLPASIWPPSGAQAFLNQPVRLQTTLSARWLLDLLEAYQAQPNTGVLAEISCRLTGLENLELPGPRHQPKGQPLSNATYRKSPAMPISPDNDPADPSESAPSALSPELSHVAVSLARIEAMLYNRAGPTVPATPKPKKKTTRKKGSKSDNVAHGSAQPPSSSDQGVSATQRGPTSPASARAVFDTTDGHPASNLRSATVLLVTAERPLRAKYGRDGARRVLALLEQFVESSEAISNQITRLLVVDSAEYLGRQGFDRLDPVRADVTGEVRSLINAALPDLPDSNAYPDTIFLIGGPEIIPMWRLPNPSFDSDAEVWSDNPYGSRDQTYLLPERIVGRQPDEAGVNQPSFLLNRLEEMITRQRRRLLPHNLQASLPLRIVEALLPSAARRGLDAVGLAGREPFEQQWSRTALADHHQFLNRAQATQLKPFMYSAAAWEASTKLLHGCMSEQARLVYSPPSTAQSLENGWLDQSRLLHFNLHGFRETADWYGQAQTARLIQNPTLNSLPVAFRPRQAAQTNGAVIFSEACYGGYLFGKRANDSIALSFLGQGARTVVGSSAISYGSAGPQLACAGHLAYFFWKEVLTSGQTFGRALQLAKVNYARIRLAAGYDLSGDDAKTLLEFSLLGNPTDTLSGSPPSAVRQTPGELTLLQDIEVAGLSGANLSLSKGGWLGNYNWEREREEFYRLRGQLGRLWERIVLPRQRYQSVPVDRLPDDLRLKIDRVLAWLLPDPLSAEEVDLRAMIDTDRSYSRPNRRGRGGGRPNFEGGWQPFGQPFERTWEQGQEWLGQVYPKGGDAGGMFSDWFEGNGPEVEADKTSGPETNAPTPIIVTGHRPLQTSDGLRFQQTFHLSTDARGDEMQLALSRGNG